MQMHLDTMEGAPSKQQLAQALAVLLSDTVTFKFLAHGYHWNVRGKDFPQFHDKFAEIYEEADGALDPLAENIRKLGFDAPFLLTDFAMLTSIEPIPVSADPIDMSAALYKANAQIIACVRDTFVIANALNEQGIANFLAERDDVHNKWAWQLGTIIGADATDAGDLGKFKADLSVEASQDVIEQPAEEIPVYVSFSDNSSYPAKRIVFSNQTERELSNTLREYNREVGLSDMASIQTLRAVYRRGVRAFVASGKPESERDSWAQARVEAFLTLLKDKKPSNPKYTQDNDLLPPDHPCRSTDLDQALTASVLASRDLSISIKKEHEYNGAEDAIYSLAEYSGLGYEVVPALRAVWKRGIENYEPPFDRAVELVTKLYNSKDSDLLPTK
jgi:starvation-inducible DNA-binding protein